jgi:uncharacterized SAM-binding protein YcdF (DUF218 family)
LLLHKLVPLFVLPFGLSLILLIWGLARKRQPMLWAGVAMLLVSSNPLIGQFLIRSAEQWAERRPAAEVRGADAIVVLSAGRSTAPGQEHVSEWGDANRFFGGVELAHAGAAPIVVFTRGWISGQPPGTLEGDILARHARALGLPAERIVLTGEVSNTADEASEVARLLHDRGVTAPRVVLVTSAFHMPRARQMFEQQGLAVDPFPVDFWLSQGGRLTVLSFVPSLGALAETQTATREFYGRAYYWLLASWQR